MYDGWSLDAFAYWSVLVGFKCCAYVPVRELLLSVFDVEEWVFRVHENAWYGLVEI